MRMESDRVKAFLRLVCASMFFVAMNGVAGLEVGATAPDYLGKDIENQQVRISDHPGKVVIVNFWATWCVPCHKELPILSILQQKAGHDRMKVFSINFKEPRRTFKKAVKALGELDVVFLRDTGSISREYEVKALPFLVIVGKDGLVKHMQTGYDESEIPHLVDKINEALLEDFEPENQEVTSP